MNLRQDADLIIRSAISSALPDAAVQSALKDIQFDPEGRIILVALGKAAWQMARAAHEALGDRISDGIVITKYDHVKGELGRLRLREAARAQRQDQQECKDKRCNAFHKITSKQIW